MKVVLIAALILFSGSLAHGQTQYPIPWAQFNAQQNQQQILQNQREQEFRAMDRETREHNWRYGTRRAERRERSRSRGRQRRSWAD